MTDNAKSKKPENPLLGAVKSKMQGKTIALTVISATFLGSDRFEAEGTPFCEIAYGPQLFKTSNGELAEGQVTWNESFKFVLVDPSVTFDFTAYTSTLFTKKKIGSTLTVGLRELLDAGTGRAKQVALKGAKGAYVGLIDV